MKNEFKFNMRFTGPMLRFELKNVPGKSMTADQMAEAAAKFMSALEHEIELSRIIEEKGIEAAIAHNSNRNKYGMRRES